MDVNCLNSTIILFTLYKVSFIIYLMQSQKGMNMFIFEKVENVPQRKENQARALVEALSKQPIGTSTLIDLHKDHAQLSVYNAFFGVKIVRKKEGDKFRFIRIS